MCRFADYFAIIKFPKEPDGDSPVPEVELKFPQQDWEDVPMPDLFLKFAMLPQEMAKKKIVSPRFYTVIFTAESGMQTFGSFLEILLNRIYERIKLGAAGQAEKLISALIAPCPKCPEIADLETAIADCMKSNVPISGETVYSLVSQLGNIHNLIVLVRAVITSTPFFFLSDSPERLCEAINAVLFLIFPFKYRFPIISMLAKDQRHYLDELGLYIIGVVRGHGASIDEETIRGIKFDLDYGEIFIPPHIKLPPVPEPFNQRLFKTLEISIYPERFASYTPNGTNSFKDKLVRASIMQFFARLVHCYQYGTRIIRINDVYEQAYNTAAFIGLRRYNTKTQQFFEDFFYQELFSEFVFSRDLLWRQKDVFDTALEGISDNVVADESEVIEEEMKAITRIAEILAENEKEISTMSASRPPSVSSDDVFGLSHLNGALINRLIAANMEKEETVDAAIKEEIAMPPYPIKKVEWETHEEVQLVFNLVDSIFENKIAQARRILTTDQHPLNSLSSRLALCVRMKTALQSSRGILSADQFELIRDLLNYALEQEGKEDRYGIAYSIMEFATVICKELGTQVFQFMYTAIQAHPVWANRDFWRFAFYTDVQKRLYDIYVAPGLNAIDKDQNPFDLWDTDKGVAVLKFVSELQKKKEAGGSETEANVNWSDMEENIIYGLAKHYTNLILCLRVPLDPEASPFYDEDDTRREEPASWIWKIIDSIRASTKIDHFMTDLKKEITMWGEGHREQLDQVHATSMYMLPPKPALPPMPPMYSKEVLKSDIYRAFLVARDEETPELPAEGAFFITNYRVIFVGAPRDPLLTDTPLQLDLPLMSLAKVKTIPEKELKGWQNRGLPAKMAEDAIVIYSTIFKGGIFSFDEEYSHENMENLKDRLVALRWQQPYPESLYPYSTTKSTTLTLQTKKYQTLRQMKKTIGKFPISKMRTLGLLPQHAPGKSYSTLPPNLNLSITAPNGPLDEEYDRLNFDHIEAATKISTINHCFRLAESYPRSLVLPKTVDDDVLGEVAKGFRSSRLPVVTWTNGNDAFLLRGASFSANVLKKIKMQAKAINRGKQLGEIGADEKLRLETREASGSNVTILRSSAEYQAAYFVRLAAIANRGLDRLDTSMFSGLLSDASAINSNATTPSLARKYNADSISIPASTSSKENESGQFQQHERRPSASILRVPFTRQHTLSMLKKNQLFILGEPGQEKSLKWGENIQFIPITYPSSKRLKSVFKKLLKTYLAPELGLVEDGSGFAAKTAWLHEVSAFLALAIEIYSLVDLANVSVAFCLEEGRDATSVISSLAQLILDPYYRTLEGFKALIEKEWIQFGHRFSHRANHTPDSQSNGVAPYFLIFLECCHQIHRQAPKSCQFNNFYLKFLAYHSQAAYYRNFLLDSEADRAKIQIVDPDDEANIWTAIENSDQSLFSNPLYKESAELPMLSWLPNNLTIWSFFTEKFLSDRHPYDPEFQEHGTNGTNSDTVISEQSKVDSEENPRHRADYLLENSRLLLACAHQKHQSSMSRNPSMDSLDQTDKTDSNCGKSIYGDNPDIVYAGYLQKKGARMKLWSPRYFVVYKSLKALRYHEEANMISEGTYFDLRGVDVQLRRVADKSVITLNTEKKNMQLLAPTADEAALFIQKLKELVA
ncbi:unnamed protein product, partial [Mesorhabditis spiculigera]